MICKYFVPFHSLLFIFWLLPLLCRNFIVWCSLFVCFCFCCHAFNAKFLKIAKTNVKEAAPQYFLLEVLWFQVLCLSLYFILRCVCVCVCVCMCVCVWCKIMVHFNCFSCWCIVFPASFLKILFFLPQVFLSIFVEVHLAKYVWVYFWAPYSAPLIHVSTFCQHRTTMITVAL